MTIQNDGYENILTGVGSQNDPTTFTRFIQDRMLEQTELDGIYRSDGLGRRIVQRPAEDMFREWFTIDAKAGQKALDRMEELRVKRQFINAVALARLYGGALVVAVIDGQDFLTPVGTNMRGKLLGFRVYDRHQVTFDQMRPSTDPLKRMQGLPEVYRVNPLVRNHDTAMGYFEVHESRCCLVPGLFVPERVQVETGGWGDSVLQPAFTALQRLGSAYGYTGNIMKEFSQSVLSVAGLTALVQSGREDVVQKRLRLLDMSKSVLNTMIIDADGEVYTRTSTSVAGLPELLDRFAESLSSAVSFPITVLMGRSPAGMNSTGDSDRKLYNDFLASEQERVATDLVEWALRLVFMDVGREPAKWSFTFAPLTQQTVKEIAEERKIIAETDKIYLDSGVLSAEEVATSRFGSGAWDMETHLIDNTERAEFASLAEPPVEVDPNAPPAEDDEKVNEDAAPESLYVSRKLVNVGDLSKWAKAQGITLKDNLHVTICYSRAPVDWMAVGTAWDQSEKGELTVPPGGPRMIDRFGPEGKAVVLLFASNSLNWRHREFLEAGASHDWGDYQPHVTLNTEGDLPAAIEPYRGKLVFGPEVFEGLDDGAE